jgi:hypothetical protein
MFPGPWNVQSSANEGAIYKKVKPQQFNGTSLMAKAAGIQMRRIFAVLVRRSDNMFLCGNDVHTCYRAHSRWPAGHSD